MFVAADLRDPEQAAAAVTAAVEAGGGRLDTVVNNAGGAPPADAATASPRFSESIVKLNLLAPLHVSQAANAVMQAQDDGGSIVNIGSVSGIRPSPGSAVYGAAKAGLVGLTQSLAVEWAPKVRLNLVTGGLIRTEQAHLFYGDEDGHRPGRGHRAARAPGHARRHRRRLPVPRLADGQLRQRRQPGDPRRRRAPRLPRRRRPDLSRVGQHAPSPRISACSPAARPARLEPGRQGRC